MKWIAAILMILNVMVFLGVSDRQVGIDVHPVAIRPDVNKESMLLLKEIEPDPAQAPDNVLESPTVVTAPDVSGMGGGEFAELNNQDLALIAASESDPLSGESDGAILGGQPDETRSDETRPADNATENTGQVESPLSREAIEPVATGDQADQQVAMINQSPSLCYRVGPFKDSSLWQRARVWADAEGIVYQPVRSQSRELRAVRVYIGPFPSINASRADVEILKEKELDYFVYLHDSNEARISLGYFTQEELATKFVEYLSKQNITARSQPEYRTLGPYDWMDIDVSSVSRSKIFEHDWGDEAVLVSERECGTG